MIYPNSYLKLHFPEIDKSDDYIIHWKYLDYFKYLISDLDNLTFGEISLARIKILEIENKITKERNDIYFNLINSFINNEYCESKKIWKNYNINIKKLDRLNDYYKKGEDNFIINDDTIPLIIINSIETNENIEMDTENIEIDTENIDLNFEGDEEFLQYKEIFDEKIKKIKENRPSYGSLDDNSQLFMCQDQSARRCGDINQVTNCFIYIFCFLWIKDLIIHIKKSCMLKETNPNNRYDFIDEPKYNKRTLLINYNFTYTLHDIHKELQDYVLDNLCVLQNIEKIENKVYFITKNLSAMYCRYIDDGIVDNDFLLKFMVSKLDSTKSYNNLNDKYRIQNSYVYFFNNGIEGIKKEINFFIKNYLNDENIEFQLPDIYILTGVNYNIQSYQKEVYSNYNFITSDCIDHFSDLLGCNLWYKIFSVVCFISQIVGPIYYIFEYMLNEENEYCPNRSNISTKIFSICYYLLLYTQFSNICEEITFMCYLYDSTSIVNCKYTFASWIINNLCLLIIPFFTYTLFIEHNDLTDLILNCLTGQFLISIDNIVVTFYTGNFFLKNSLKDQMLVDYLEKGVNIDNMMEVDSLVITAFNILGIIQSYITLALALIIGRCI